MGSLITAIWVVYYVRIKFNIEVRPTSAWPRFVRHYFSCSDFESRELRVISALGTARNWKNDSCWTKWIIQICRTDSFDSSVLKRHMSFRTITHYSRSTMFLNSSRWSLPRATFTYFGNVYSVKLSGWSSSVHCFIKKKLAGGA